MGGSMLSAAALLVIIISPLFLNQAAAASTSIDEWLQKVQLPNEKLAKIEFYTNPSGAEAVPVANAGNITVPPANFGLVAVVDFRLTAGPNLTSSDFVGRGQGFFTSSSMTDFSFFTALNILFQTGQYKDSTLTFVGYDPTGPDSRELNIIGEPENSEWLEDLSILAATAATLLTTIQMFLGSVQRFCTTDHPIHYIPLQSL